MSEKELIEGKVARILNVREVAVNVGSMHGVKKGMYFDVLDLSGKDICDPDTDEVLGSIERHKIRLKVTHVQEKLSVLSTYRSWEVNVGGNLGLGTLGSALMPANYVTKHETLKSKENKMEEIDEDESIVQIGDLVREYRKNGEQDE